MKNQYFGDRRDLLKYDLLCDVVESHGAQRLTYLPMLTPNNDSGEGNLKQADRRKHRPEIFNFLKSSVEAGLRDIRQLRDLMPLLGISLMPYCDDAWFAQDRRREYFDAVPAEHLVKSVVFFDPDTGLEPRSQSYMYRRGPEQYLLNSELLTVWNRASQDSVFVVYQHLQQNAAKHVGDVDRRLAEVSRLLQAPTLAVRWHDLAFIAAAKCPEGVPQLRVALMRYAHRHELDFREAAGSS